MCFAFETHCVPLAGLELAGLKLATVLLLSPEFWDCRYAHHTWLFKGEFVGFRGHV